VKIHSRVKLKEPEYVCLCSEDGLASKDESLDRVQRERDLVQTELPYLRYELPKYLVWRCRVICGAIVGTTAKLSTLLAGR
jgi:hypothetical protein